MTKPLKIPEQESEYLAMPGRKSYNGVGFQSEGSEVKQVQEALLALGYELPKFGADSNFGKETDEAVRKFQKKHKDLFIISKRKKNPPLRVDGIVGPKTALALNCALARAGIWFDEHKHEWTDKEGHHLIHCTRGTKISSNPEKEQKVRWHIGDRSFIQFVDGGFIRRPKQAADSSLTKDWTPLTNKKYEYIAPDNQKIEGETNEMGFVLDVELESGGKIMLKLSEEAEILEYPPNPIQLPALDLRNRAQGGQGPLQRRDSRRSLVEHLQQMLKELGHDLGTSGPEKDGVDGLFMDKTEEAVKEFQRSHVDWDAQQLLEDGLVGPRTSDALNREFVGIWYPNYETPTQLTPRRKIVTMTEAFAVKEGLSL